jgi:hypothetical protein
MADEPTSHPVQRDGSGKFVEVYPAAALTVWGFRGTGYKGPSGAGLRHKLVEKLLTRTAPWLRIPASARDLCEESDDALDSLVASLVTRAAAVGRCEPVTPGAEDRARREGWIALPVTGSLADLATTSPPVPA